MENLGPEIADGFSDRLKGCLEAEKMSQSDLARAVGSSPTAISMYLKGRIPEALILFAIARTLKVSIEWLLTGEGPMRRGEGDPGTASFDVPGGLSAFEAKLIALFRRLPEHKQKRFPGLLAFLADEEATDYKQEIEELTKELEKGAG